MVSWANEGPTTQNIMSKHYKNTLKVTLVLANLCICHFSIVTFAIFDFPFNLLLVFIAEGVIWAFDPRIVPELTNRLLQCDRRPQIW
jgi:hypothetical protein